MTRWTLLFCAVVCLQATGCADGEHAANAERADPTLALGDASSAPDVSSEQDGGTETITGCIRCPLAMSSCDAEGMKAEPSYDEARAAYLARCAPQQDEIATFPIVSAGHCTSSGLRFLQINGGLGMERRYFDSQGTLVGILTESDYVDPVCGGLREWPQHMACDQTSPEVLCGSRGGPAPTP